MNKIVIASDLHLHRWNNFGYHADTLLPKRLFDQQEVLKQIVNIIRNVNAKTFINGGDLFHSVGNIPVEALNIAHQFYKTLDEMGVTCLFCPGNHDMIKRESPEWFHLSNAIFDQERDIELGCKIKLIGYDEKVDYDKVKGYDIVVIHQTPMNVMLGNHKLDDGVNWKKLALQNKLVFFGHIHHREKLGDNCYIVGSPMHLNFGDSGQRGVYLVNPEEDFKAEFVKLTYPEFITVDSVDEVKDNQNYYRVLGTDKRIDKENVVSVVIPKSFKERIKSDEFEVILKEWLIINEKEAAYLKLLKPLLTTKSNLGSKVFSGRITDIHINDFISIGEIDHTFKDGFTSISGPNGNGKTAFVDSIFWCLFGETTKGLTGNDVIRRGCDDCGVSLRLVSDDVIYSVFRSRKSGLDIFIEGSKTPLALQGMKASDRQQVLEDILGFNKSVFLSACYFSQENVKTLTGLTDTEKTNMITNLLGFETYDDLYTSVSAEITGKRDSVEVWETKKKDLEVSVDISTSALDIIENEVKTVKGWVWDHKVAQDKHKAEINELKNKDDIGSPFVPIDYDKKLSDLNIKTSSISEAVDVIDTELVSLGKKKEAISIKVTEVKARLATAQESVTVLEREISLLRKSDLGEKCDKCGGMITEETVGIFIKDKEDKVAEVKSTHFIQDELKPLLDRRKAVEEELSDLAISKSDKNKESRTIREDRESFMGLKKKQDLQVQEIAKKDAEIEAQIESLFALIQESKESVKAIKERQDELGKKTEEENEKIETLKSQIFEAEENIGKLKDDMDVFEFWKMAFSAKGIRSLLMDRFCNQFNAIVNDYLSKASNGRMSIVLNPIKTLKSGEDRNKISLDIMLDEAEVSYASLSGGEKRRVDVSLCLTLNKWLSNRCGLSNGLLGLIIFDELFSFLDREGEENIGELLYEEGSDKIILVISHTPELASYAQRILNISKVNGVSKLMA